MDKEEIMKVISAAIDRTAETTGLDHESISALILNALKLASMYAPAIAERVTDQTGDRSIETILEIEEENE